MLVGLPYSHAEYHPDHLVKGRMSTAKRAHIYTVYMQSRQLLHMMRAYVQGRC